MVKISMEATGQLISNIGEDNFANCLSNALREVTPFDFTVVFGYLGSAQPFDLYDDFPRVKKKIFVEDYQEGPYLLDPFYLASTKPIESGLYRLRDLAPDRFYQSEYFRNYYVQTGLTEEIAFFANLPDKAVVIVSLMRTKKSFTAKEVRDLGRYLPVVLAACHKNWFDLASKFGISRSKERAAGRNRSLELAFEKFGKDLLTAREREVVEFTLKGHSAVAVGQILEISPGTVRIHRRNIYSKLRIRSQGELFSGFIKTLLENSPEDSRAQPF
jgi:DNA-binding CsgD family transcriptional regulator